MKAKAQYTGGGIYIDCSIKGRIKYEKCRECDDYKYIYSEKDLGVSNHDALLGAIECKNEQLGLF